MARHATSGRYAVPKEIEVLKPNDIECFVKVVYANSRTVGSNKHFYVYTVSYKPDPKYPNKGKHSSGKAIGKIEGGKFVPNDAYLELKAPKPKEASCEQESTEIKGATEEEIARVRQAAINMHLDLGRIDLQIKNYGEYAVVLASTASVLANLEHTFSDNDSRAIYAMGVIYFIEEYTPASYLKDVYDQSILAIKWPTLAVSENSVNTFLHQLGGHPGTCEEYSQSIINESSGVTAIDGHVILSCSKRNDLADYGNKYQKLGNKQVNLLQAYDVENGCSLVTKAYEGGLPDKGAIKDMLTTYDFPKRTCFLVDMGFYSEDNLGLYRKDGKHFIIPVPENTVISKALRLDYTFTGEFKYERTDENGAVIEDVILFRMSTVKELEDLHQIKIDEKNELDFQKEIERCKGTDEKPKKKPTRKVTRSKYPDDLVIMYRDSTMHDKMVAEYESQIGSDSTHTREELAKLGPTFGVILLRTNYTQKNGIEKKTYFGYKKRWGIETHYNFVENTIHFCGLQQSDYLAMQGLSFMITIVGQIKSAFVKQMRKASQYVQNMSINKCLEKAARVKLAQHKNKEWYAAVTVKEVASILTEMGVDIASDIEKINNQTY